jgi:hypothetical protein
MVYHKLRLLDTTGAGQKMGTGSLAGSWAKCINCNFKRPSHDILNSLQQLTWQLEGLPVTWPECQ